LSHWPYIHNRVDGNAATDGRGERNQKRSRSTGLDQGSATFSNKRHILLHFPADITAEGPQNVDTVLFFRRLHMTTSQIVLNLILIVAIIKCKFRFDVLSNPDKVTSEEPKSRMRRRIHWLSTPAWTLGRTLENALGFHVVLNITCNWHNCFLLMEDCSSICFNKNLHKSNLL